MLCLKLVEKKPKCSTSACVLAALFESCADLASDVVVAPDATQVLSLTQFYSVDFSKSRTDVKKSAFSTNAQSRFASVVVDSVLGPLRLARDT